MRAAASVNHWLHAFPPSAFLVTFQTDSCVSQTSTCKRPVESVDYSPFCNVRPQDKLSMLTAVVYPQGQSLQTASLLSQSLSFLFFFLRDFTSFGASLYSSPIMCFKACGFVCDTIPLHSVLFCESHGHKISVLFSSVWLSVTINTSFTFCKVKLIIMILLSGGLEGLIYWYNGCSEIWNYPISWHIQS